MKRNILIVGINGSLGKRIKSFYNKDSNFRIYGTSSNPKNINDYVFLLDFVKNETINKIK